MTDFADLILWVVLPAQLVSSGYLALLAVGAVLPRRRSSEDSGQRVLPRLAVVIPAHNEEILLPRLLASLRAQSYPSDLFQVHVLADNCSDSTATVASAYGAIIHERHDQDRPGKGQAIAWLLPQLLELDAHAFVFIDADSKVDANFLEAIAGHLAAGCEVLQTSYRVAEPDSSPLRSLRAMAFALMHELRGRGKSRFGISAGIWGNGVVFSRTVLAKIGWSSFSSVEDAEQHLRLVLAGHSVQFVSEASVHGDMPDGFRAARSQQVRWEAGRLALLRRYGLRMARRAVTSLDPGAACALLEVALPPLSVLVAMQLITVVLAIGLGGTTADMLSAAAFAGLCFYAIAGLRFSGLRARSYFALLYAPSYIIWKVLLYARELTRQTDSAWVRTTRDRSGTKA
jgi:cellulose synthase/poly-beta-1,6-N-acetylglucosamine synthase-like glycosyltransferase